MGVIDPLGDHHVAQARSRHHRVHWKARDERELASIGLAGIVVEPTDDLHRLQQALIDAITPFTVKAGTQAAFMSTEHGHDIQPFLLQYVANFTTIAAGPKFNPHVTIGVATEDYLNKMLAEPFEAFTFSPTGASVYQLGSFGTARKELKPLPFTA